MPDSTEPLVIMLEFGVATLGRPLRLTIADSPVVDSMAADLLAVATADAGNVVKFPPAAESAQVSKGSLRAFHFFRNSQ